MKSIHILIILSILIMGSGAFAQTLMRPFGINKQPAQMELESQQAKEFFGHTETAPPRKFDLIKMQSPVKNQGHRGSCVAFASVALMESMYKVKTGQSIDLSEQFAYWDSKVNAHIAPYSEGSDPLRFLKNIEKNGVPPEHAWSYEPIPWYEDKSSHPDCFKANEANPEHVPTECLTNGNAPAQALAQPRVKIFNPHTIPSSPEAITGFIRNGMAVEVAADIYDAAWSYTQKGSPGFISGTVTMPTRGDKLIGGHAILIVGYDMDKEMYIFKNSWGTDRWAARGVVPGYGLIPFNYIRKYAEAYVARMP